MGLIGSTWDIGGRDCLVEAKAMEETEPLAETAQ